MKKRMLSMAVVAAAFLCFGSDASAQKTTKLFNGKDLSGCNDRTIENDFNLSEVEQNLLSDLCNAFHALDKKVIVCLLYTSNLEP